MKGKKGGERVMSVYWFVIFIIITTAIVSGVMLFRNKAFDVRNAEADLLSDKMIKCFVESGKLNYEIWNSLDNSNVLEKCGFVFNGEYFVMAKINEKEIKAGNSDIEPFCELEKETEKNVPFCAKKKLMVLNENSNDFILAEIYGGVRKTENA
jgi:cell division protein YceG involved in septum cleavage